MGAEFLAESVFSGTFGTTPYYILNFLNFFQIILQIMQVVDKFDSCCCAKALRSALATGV